MAWHIELPGAGASSPIVNGDRLYLTCYSGYGAQYDQSEPNQLLHHLVCVQRSTGKILWDKTVAGNLEKEARQVQKNEHGFASPTPITDGKAIYCYFGKTGVVKFDLDGNQQWKTSLGSGTGPRPEPLKMGDRELPPLRWGAASSPLLFENLVIVNASEESDSLRALDQETGDLVWKVDSAKFEGSAMSPRIFEADGQHVLVVAVQKEYWGMDPKSGGVLWSIETGNLGGLSPSPIGAEGVLYAFGGAGKGHALRLGKLGAGQKPEDRILWESKNTDIPSGVLHKGLIHLVQTKGMAACLEAESGKSVFDGRLEGRTGSVYASPTIAGDRLYVVSRKRGTFVYSTDGKYELLAHNQIEGDDSQFNASPVMVGRELFLRSDKSLYCIVES